MTTQFRSRIKTVVNYGEKESSTGGCCLPDGTKVNNITFYDCIGQNGFFRQGDATDLQCPDRGLTGCCCACSYIRDQEGDFESFLDERTGVLSSNPLSTQYYDVPSGSDVNEIGMKDNVTQCECNSRGGKWFYGNCSDLSSVQSFCGNVELNTDVRMPAACCHGNTLTGDLNCTNVCTVKECSDLAGENSSTYFGTDANGNGALCDYSFNGLDPIQCGTDAIQRLASNQNYQQDFQNSLFPCFELQSNNGILSHTCSLKTPKDCYDASGFQYPRNTNSIDTCSDVSVITPRRGTGSYRILPPVISESELPVESSNVVFEGGLYVGVFDPQNSFVKKRVGDTLLNQRVRNYGNGAGKRKWALIYSFRPYGDNGVYTRPNDYKIYTHRMNTTSEPSLEVPTSMFDGFFNTHGNGSDFQGYPSELFENIRSLVYNGYNDWYIPSIDELSFIYSKNNPFASAPAFWRTSQIGDLTYLSYMRNLATELQFRNMMSSSLYSVNDKLGEEGIGTSGQLVNRRGYFYAQNMAHNVDRHGLVYKEDRRTPMMVPLVRRIYIE
jgi:hypothetical protein